MLFKASVLKLYLYIERGALRLWVIAYEQGGIKRCLYLIKI